MNWNLFQSSHLKYMTYVVYILEWKIYVSKIAFFMQIYSDRQENYGKTIRRNPSLAPVCLLIWAGGSLLEDPITGTTDIIEMLKDYKATYGPCLDEDIERPSWLTKLSTGFILFFKNDCS